jgi:spermidine synthase
VIRPAIIAVFFVSGAAGLIYEIVWTRSFSLIFGVTTYAVATVLATFMGGLALGSYLLGGWADDRRRSPLVRYALLELGVGFYALLVPVILAALRPVYIELARSALPFALLTVGRVVLAALVLLPPTTLMGGTFPILVRYFVRSRSEVGRAAGALYFVNTAGALAGCLGAGFHLIEHLGHIGATRVAAGMSIAAAAAAALLARVGSLETASAPEAPAPANEPTVVLSEGTVRVVLAVIGVSGFTGLAYEVLWTRALPRYVINSTYAFTVMLATFLGAIALGSAVHGLFLRRRRRPLFVFAAIEAGIAVGFALSALLFAHLPAVAAAIRGTEIVGSFRASILTMFISSSLILFFPALCLGATVPLATEICARSLSRLGATVGRVYAFNTCGAIVGSLATGFLLIPAIGMQTALIFVISTNVLLSLVLVAAESASAAERIGAGVAVAAVSAGALFFVPPDLFRSTFAPANQKIIFYSEGATDTVAVVEGMGQRTIMYEDRRGTAGTNSYPFNFLLGHLPMLIHPGEPRTVLHICFGVGNSLSAVTAHESVERIDNVELSPHVLLAAEYFWTNNHVLSNPKVRTIIDDGRNFVMASRERYDVIILEPPETFTAGVINLYTREFYRDAGARLADDGVMLQWMPHGEAPLEEELMLFRAFYDAFPDATAWRLHEGGPTLFIGTKRPLRIDYQRLQEKMGRERIRQDLKLIGVDDVDHLLALFLFDSSAFRELALQAQPVTEDRTVLDFSMPRYLGTGFGLGTFNPVVRHGFEKPLGASFERNKWYFGRRRSVMPLLTNLGAEDPRAIESRIEAWATELRDKRKPIARNLWRRWEPDDGTADPSSAGRLESARRTVPRG